MKTLDRVREMFQEYINPTHANPCDLPDITSEMLIDWMVDAGLLGRYVEGFIPNTAVMIKCKIYQTHIEISPSFKADYKYMEECIMEYSTIIDIITVS